MATVKRKIREAVGAMKDQTSIGLARVLPNSGVPATLEIAIVKATSHDAQRPIDEKYVHEILFLVSNSPGSVAALAMGLSKRFHKTHNWVVALKGLMLIHRLLRGGGRKFEKELRLSRARGLLNFNLCNFRVGENSSSRDFIAFLRSYSLFLEERMDWFITCSGKLERVRGHGYAGKLEEISNIMIGKVKNREQMVLEFVFDRLPKYQLLLDCVIACSPDGLTRSNILVQSALNSVAREGIQLYANVCDGIASLIDTFLDMDTFLNMQYLHCLLAFEIYKKAASQSHELSHFFEKCKEMNVFGSFQYPVVGTIGQEHVDSLEEFIQYRSEVTSWSLFDATKSA